MKFAAGLLALTIAFSSSPLGYGGEVSAAQPERPVMSGTMQNFVIDSYDDELSEQGASFSAKYDPRKSGKVTKIREQGQYGSCWVFASVAAMECNLIKKGLARKSIDLSENQLLYFFYNRQTDPIGYTKGDKNIPLKADWLDTGGNGTALSLSAMTWSGVTTEKKSVYPSTPANSLSYVHDYVVKNVHYYNYSVSDVKKAVKKYGAVAVGMCYDTKYVNEYTGAAYCPTEEYQNHEVAIVGWDDSYSKENFAYTPKANGAWIVKNSYGTDVGDKGYFYISYYDSSLAGPVAYDMVKKSASYDNNYQYDGTSSDYFFNTEKGMSVANVFKAKAKKGKKEKLKAIGLCTYSDNTKYSIQIYTNVKNKKNPESGKKMLASAQTGKVTDAGYVTIPLKKGVTLKYGQTYAVVVKILSKSRIGVDGTEEYDWISYSANVSKNQSYVKYDGYWYDYGSMFKYNFRIKAFTDTL